jgi:hypothetical protein
VAFANLLVEVFLRLAAIQLFVGHFAPCEHGLKTLFVQIYSFYLIS